MAGRYIPPHLRNRSSIDNSPDHQGRYTIEDLATHYQTNEHRGTINRSSNDQTSISHILIFRQAHPEWPPRIYCKTNLDLLERYSTSTTTGSNTSDDRDSNLKDEIRNKSIPVFGEVGRDTFDFLGYYIITSVTFLEPRSEALVALLEAKFSRGKNNTKERRADQWKGSLGLHWAIVTLERDKSQAGKGCEVVKRRAKSVTEQLNELRLRDQEEKEKKSQESHMGTQKRENLDPGSPTPSTESHVVIDVGDDVQSDDWSLLSGESVDKTYDKHAFT